MANRPTASGVAGVWWVWLSTCYVPWLRSLALGILALVVLANGYSDLFDDHWGNVWRTVNPLFIGSSSVAGVAMAVRMHCRAYLEVVCGPMIDEPLTWAEYVETRNERLASLRSAAPPYQLLDFHQVLIDTAVLSRTFAMQKPQREIATLAGIEGLVNLHIVYFQYGMDNSVHSLMVSALGVLDDDVFEQVQKKCGV